MKRLLLVLAVFFLFCVNVYAVSFEGLNLKNSLVVDNQTLVLDGYGIRPYYALIFKVKVYIGALYSTFNPPVNPEKLVESRQPKVILMHFLRDVSSKQIRDGFIKDFKHNMPSFINNKDEKAFLGLINKDVKENDDIYLIFLKNGDLVVSYGKLDPNCKNRINSFEAQKAVLLAFVGKKPYSKKFKKELLGIEKP